MLEFFFYMIGTKFIDNKRREFIVIQKHKVFDNVWRCYPVYFNLPNRPYKIIPTYMQELIKCFDEKFIKENLVDCKNSINFAV